MKIALVNQPWDGSLPPESSLSIWTYEMAKRLASRCDVVVYGRHQPGQPREQWSDGIRYRHVEPMFQRRSKWLRRLSFLLPPATFQSWHFHLGYILPIARELDDEQIDVVHVFNLAQFGGIVCRLSSARVVLNMQCEWLSQLDPRIIRRWLRHVDLICGCSNYITDKIKTRFSECAAKCHTLYNGVDMSRFLPRSLTDGHPTVLFVGRISPEKGIHVLIDAFARVAERIPEARLEIVGPDAQCPASYIVELGANDPQISHLMRFYGDRGYFEQLREQVDRLGLASRVQFVGALQHDEAPTMFQHATVLANTGFSEAFGMSLVEAMASSVPVVATRIGGMTELIEQSQAGLLCEAGDEKKLADGLLCLMKDSRKNKLMGMRGCQWVRTTCCWEQLAEQFFNHCRRMIHADAGDDDAFAVQADPVVSGLTEGPPDHD